MGYDVLSDDLYEDSPAKKKPRRAAARSSGQEDSEGFNYKYIHIAVVVLLLLLLLFFLLKNITFSFNGEEPIEKISIIGDLNTFDKKYVGDLSLYSSEFFLKTPDGNFNSQATQIDISNFSGNIFLENRSIMVKGTGNEINYGNNVVKLNGRDFTLRSVKKTKLNLYFENISLDMGEGLIKISDQLNHEFENATIDIKNFNSSFTYDGTFSIAGECKELKLKTTKPKLTIVYENLPPVQKKKKK